MDPLSITVSVITLAGAASAVVKSLGKLSGLRDAGDELCTLINEVSDLRLVLLEVDFVIREKQDKEVMPQAPISSLQAALDTARGKLLELDQLVHYRLIRPQTTAKNFKPARVAWLKEKSRLKALQRSIRSSKIDLTALLGVITW